MRHTHQTFGPPVLELTKDVALMLGIHAGDGWLSDRWGVAFNSADKQMLEEVRSLAKRVLRLEPYVTKSGNTMYLVSGKRQARELFLRYGFGIGPKAGNVSVPCQVLATKDSGIAASFLRGLFSTDGCLSFRERSARCVLQVSSLSLCDGFTELASRIGFAFRRYDYLKTTGHNKLPIHVAYLGRREPVVDWMNRVGSICDSHSRRFLEWKAVVKV